MENKDAIIKQQEAVITELRQQIEMLLKRIEQLEDEVARLKKDSHNSSKPPSSDIVKPVKILRRFGKRRNRGGQHGHNKFSRQPFESKDVDEVIEYELKGKDAIGLKPLDEWFVIQQISLPKKMYMVIEHRARKYADIVTGKIHIAAMPDEVRKGGLFGADINAAVGFMKGKCHMSYAVIQSFFKEIMKLDISTGMFCKAVQKTSSAMQIVYEQLVKRLPYESQIGIDETGHHDDGKLHWTWCFDTAAYSVFKIDKSRGCEVLKKTLGIEFNGLVCADYWGAYRKYARLFDVRMQYCMAHLIRDIRFLAEHSIKKLSRWGDRLLKRIRKMFNTLHCRDKLTAEGFIRSLKRIKEGFLKIVRRPPDHTLAKKMARRFKGEAAEDYFRFLAEPDVEPTNNNTERQIRPVVIDRRITQGTRGDAGMRWCERIWTVLATCKKQNINVFDFIQQTLLAHWKDKCYPKLL
jgi:transposase